MIGISGRREASSASFLPLTFSKQWIIYSENITDVSHLALRILVDASHGSELQVRAVASLSYTPRTEREVSLRRGQLVMLAARLNTHWYLGRVTGGSGQERMGLVPGNV